VHNGAAAAVVVLKKEISVKGGKALMEKERERERESLREFFPKCRKVTLALLCFSWLYSYIAKNDILKTKVLK
jgi:hypothetical protein